MYHVRLLVAGLAIFAGTSGQAETLADTMIKAYQLSPLLDANRAALRGIDEGVAQARAGRRPQISAGASARSNFDDDEGSRLDTYQVQLGATLSLYDGGNSKAAIESAKAGVLAARAQLVDVEQTVLLQAVTAYMDVRRDQQFVSLGLNNVSVLEQQVRAATDRFELGDITRTDVSLAEARLAAARASLAAARGRLDASRETYLAVVGIPARNLQAPPTIPALPPSLSDSELIAMREHPGLNAARQSVTGAEWDLERAKSSSRPTLNAGASVSVSRRDPTGAALNNSHDSNNSAELSLTGNLPLYTGGRNSSLVRQAQTFVSQRKFELQNTARQVRQEVAFAWSDRAVARASIIANRQQVEAAQIAFNGVQDEATLGSRTTLDVLDREQELRDAQVQLASSIRDEYVAAYNLLAAMGLLTVQHLNLGIPVYDPHANYEKVQKAPMNPSFSRKVDRIKGLYNN